MPITNDIRTYADSALEQGKYVVGHAQNQINDVTGQANHFVGVIAGTAKDNVTGLTSKAAEAVSDLRSQAEKLVNIDGIKTAVEPYLAQAKQYRNSVTDRAEGILEVVKSDKRVATVIMTAESLTDVVVETVRGRVVRPVTHTLARRKPFAKKPPVTVIKPTAGPVATKPAPKATAPRNSKPAATRPAAKISPRKAAPAKTAQKTAQQTAAKAGGTKTPTKTTARKSTARKTSQN